MRKDHYVLHLGALMENKPRKAFRRLIRAWEKPCYSEQCSFILCLRLLISLWTVQTPQSEQNPTVYGDSAT